MRFNHVSFEGKYDLVVQNNIEILLLVRCTCKDFVFWIIDSDLPQLIDRLEPKIGIKAEHILRMVSVFDYRSNQAKQQT